jgi:4-carboxymuconolactone decarboxylase
VIHQPARRLTRALAVLALALVLVPCADALAQARMPPIPPEKMTPEQKAAAEEFMKTRQAKNLPGPFIALLRSPKLLNLASNMGIWTRETSLSPKLFEFVVIITSRELTQNFEWRGHAANALKNGLHQDIVAAVADGRRPRGMPEEEEIVYDFITELLRYKGVSDATYARTVSKFGEEGVIDMIGISGYYWLIGLVLNTAHQPLGPGEEPGLEPFPR